MGMRLSRTTNLASLVLRDLQREFKEAYKTKDVPRLKELSNRLERLRCGAETITERVGR
jgi:hypothetical protein